VKMISLTQLYSLHCCLVLLFKRIMKPNSPTLSKDQT